MGKLGQIDKQCQILVSTTAHHVLLSIDELQAEIVRFLQPQMLEHLIQEHLARGFGLGGERKLLVSCTTSHVKLHGEYIQVAWSQARLAPLFLRRH